MSRLVLPSAFGLALLVAGCAPQDLGSAGGLDYRVYAVTPDALAPAIQETMADLRWLIEEVEVISPTQYTVKGIYGGAYGGIVTRSYRVQVIVESIRRNFTSVSIAVSDTHHGHGPTIDHRRLRNQFFRELEKREVVFPAEG